ncbi:MAG: hypothetical protein FWF41_04845 [Betaproteobacteria bacterium]|nr:hypothetical protein [Betaproteobacteria bacterium]
MNIYKLHVHETGYRNLTRESFESETRVKAPWYQKNEKGEDVHYAVCPVCDNPVSIVGLYSFVDKAPFGRHHNRSIEKLAMLNIEEREGCSLYKAISNRTKQSRRSKLKGIPEKILSLVINEFDKIAYVMKAATGISYSDNLLRAMLEDYKSAKGYLYTGASTINIPWTFLYMTNSKSLYMQKVTNPRLLEAITRKVKDAEITEDGRIGKSKEGKFFNLNFCFIHHKSEFNENFQETMKLLVTLGEKNDIYKETINFDHAHFQRVLLMKDFRRVSRLNDLAREVLGDIQ